MATQKEKLEAAETRVKELETENEELKTENVELNKKLAIAEKNAGTDLPVFEFDGAEYQLTVPAVMYPGAGKIEAVKVAKSPEAYKEVLEGMIEKNSPLLRKVEASEEK